ncbi:TetR family transcriptional regulator [Nonomuraea sp. FMUSA5-5]|uniref:TetR family transcriptional regulator n=1 Tax=Nonomuraea composti TaxID=2720023 RepID=A0ABX1BLM7_9ACTN|nr:TetR family transcriptional regulator [Nonomuraea sp. FMUSA5-5]NJP96018.1 TetR family transcriptional regulator [Nonomuraea sp. FMUSA5-5]
MALVEEIARQLLARAEETGAGPLAALHLEEIAALYGVSRSTLLRQIGSRKALDAALAELGAQGAPRQRVADRAIAAAADLIAKRGVGGTTLEDVAAAAECSVQAIHAQIGGRDALLVAIFKHYSPMDGIAAALADPPADLTASAQAVYLAILDAVLDTPAIAPMLAEVLARPDSALGRYVRESYVASTVGLIEQWLEEHLRRGTIRPMRLRLLMTLFGGPIAAEALSHATAGSSPGPAYRRRTARELAESFALAVQPRGTTSTPAGDVHARHE